MPGVVQIRQGGPATWEVEELILGGQLVEPGTAAGKLKVAEAGTAKCLGVALNDAAPEGPDFVGPTLDPVTGRYNLSSVMLPSRVSVAYAATEVKLKFSANAAWGDIVVVTADGTVAPAGATPDPETFVGRVTDPAGVVFATSPYGIVRLFN